MIINYTKIELKWRIKWEFFGGSDSVWILFIVILVDRSMKNNRKMNVTERKWRKLRLFRKLKRDKGFFGFSLYFPISFFFCCELLMKGKVRPTEDYGNLFILHEIYSSRHQDYFLSSSFQPFSTFDISSNVLQWLKQNNLSLFSLSLGLFQQKKKDRWPSHKSFLTAVFVIHELLKIYSIVYCLQVRNGKSHWICIHKK